MLISEIRERLAVAVEDVASADTGETLMGNAKQACELSRSLNFGLARQWSSDPQLLGDIAMTLADAASLIGAQITSVELSAHDAALIRAMAKNIAERVDDIRGYARTPTLARTSG